MPVWDKTISNVQIVNEKQVDKQNAILSGQISSNKLKGVFFVPLLDTITKEVKAYIYGTKESDSSYRYQVFNKTDILKYPVKDTNQIKNGQILLSIFTGFEKKFEQ